ncbi:hypothetical protein MSSIT_2135 [Methanosarcina siciliae T4/M]|uniref:Core-binding (CB) domain-containing protein n=2 Tax=Methanosarcina siciliae TaxID=38027 RepID=A0A0E3PF28_9EURY|nr:site-specific integrase [Methanosarcina siciliae]AKB28854.1 hypothetical protein MSSIT_2135 [Methanosarcina siciliae T4/M]AKB32785.1 hypothetical protein MSSIH_2095 [Methanosarcina siciliae HI350]
MKVGELETDPAIQEWFASLIPGDATKQVYLYSMQEYTEHTGLSPIELIEEAEEEIQAGILPRKRKIRAYMLGFKQALIKKRLSDFTIRSRLTGVRSFYKAAYIEIPAQLSDRRRPMTIKENDQVPKKSDIRDVLKVADPLEKAVVLTGVSAGLPSNEIRKLRISDFKKGKNPETGITTLDLRRFKARVDFITFLTPEATAAIDEYLVYRDREAKAPTARRKRQLENQRVVSDDGFLFILRQIPPEYAETGDEMS